jgi:tripartite-type tricarboxylate transporter receptor subunit TctC
MKAFAHSFAQSFVLAVSVAAGVFPGPAAAQDLYPTRVVRLIVPFPPGGSTDIVGRVVAQKLTEAWGQQVIVDNRGGAGGQIGAELAAHSPADGYTLVVGHIGTFGVNPSLYPKLRYDAIKDFVPISLVARVPNMLVVHPSLPVQTVKQLVDLAKARPGKLFYGSSGSGSNPFLCVEFFKMLTKTDIVHVPYKGTGPMLIDLVGGQISLTINGVPPLLPHVQAKRLQPIAVASDKRLALLPALPTVIESGVPDYEVVQWYGVLAPANTPRDIVNKVNADINKFLARPDTASRMSGEGAIPSGSTPEQFGKLIRSEIERWAKVVKATGAKAE